MKRLEMNLTTGELREIQLTPTEIADAMERTTAEAARKIIDDKAAQVATIKAEMATAVPDIVEALLNDDKPDLEKLRQEHAARKAKLK